MITKGARGVDGLCFVGGGAAGRVGAALYSNISNT